MILLHLLLVVWTVGLGRPFGGCFFIRKSLLPFIIIELIQEILCYYDHYECLDYLASECFMPTNYALHTHMTNPW